MNEMRIELTTNLQSGRPQLIIHLERADDLMPHEHESLHRKLIEQLSGSGLEQLIHSGDIHVERVDPPLTGNQITRSTTPSSQSASLDESNEN